MKTGRFSVFLAIGIWLLAGAPVFANDKEVDRLLVQLRVGLPETRVAAAERLGELRRDPDRVVPVLSRLLSVDDRWLGGTAAAALTRFGESAVPPLVAQLKGPRDAQTEAMEALWWLGPAAKDVVRDVTRVLKESAARDEYEPRMLMCEAVRTLGEIGPHAAPAERLAAQQAGDDSDLAAAIFHTLLPYRRLALGYLTAHPTMPSRLQIDTALQLKAKSSAEYTALKRAVLERDDLPLQVMVALRDARYIAVIKTRMPKVDAHRRSYLAACARALGDPPGRVVRISEKRPGDFRPAGDPRRVHENMQTHGDGVTPVMITGRIVMPDGLPALGPKFFLANDTMLLAQKRKDPAPLHYDRRTGRFVFRTGVFAAFSIGEGPREPGPYMTGRREVIVQAQGAKPLTVCFYDEMPDVEVTLSWKK